MTILTDIQADTSCILADWQETVTFKRATAPISTAGEENLSWYTSLVTACDVQAVVRGQRGKGGYVTAGGFEFSPEYAAFVRHGLDVKEDDRFSHDGFTVYVNLVRRDEDKLQLFCSRRSRDAT